MLANHLLVKRQVVLMSVWVAKRVQQILSRGKTVEDNSLLVARCNELVIPVCFHDCATKCASGHHEEGRWAHIGCSSLALSQPVQEHFINQL